MGEQLLRFSDEAFNSVLSDADKTLQRLLNNMVEKNSAAGTLNIKIDIELIPHQIKNFDPAIQGDSRDLLIPKLSHKVSSVMQIKDETKGGKTYDGYELARDGEYGEYVIKPVITEQRSIFDDDFQSDPEEHSENNAGIAFPVKSISPEVPETKAVETTDQKPAGPLEYLSRFAGQEIRVFEALGNYTVRTSRNAVALSSAFSPTNQFYCAAEILKPHVGHAAECVIDESGEVSIVCKKCGEVLFALKPGQENAVSADNDKSEEESGLPEEPVDDGEPDDISDVFDGYPYENSRTMEGDGGYAGNH